MAARFIENSEEDEAWRMAAVRSLDHAQQMHRLAAARTRAAALATLEGSKARQRLRLVPYVLAVGQVCRVAYLVSSAVRRHTKASIVKAFLPQYTREFYEVVARRRAPGRSNLFTYDLEMRGVEPGQQGECLLGGLRVRLPERLSGVDRRYLWAAQDDSSATQTLAQAYPHASYAQNLLSDFIASRAAATSDDESSDDEEFE